MDRIVLGLDGTATSRDAASFADDGDLEAAEHDPALCAGVANHLHHRADNLDARALELDNHRQICVPA